jgi:putative flippase GtrA
MIFFKYIFVQIAAYILDIGIFLIILNFDAFGPVGANIFSKICAGCFAFFVQRRFTFNIEKPDLVSKQAIRYFLVLLINIPIASIILAFIYFWLPFSTFAKIISDVICVGFSYLLSKKFIYAEAVSTKNSDMNERK